MGLAAITGASSGLGAMFAKKLAARGYDLLLIARRRENLEAVAADILVAHPVKVEILVADLADRGDLERTAARLEAENGLSLLVNNAGFGTVGRFWETDFARQEEMHRLHVMAPLRLTRAALRPLLVNNAGGIINVGSVAGFFRSPGNVSYCATKTWTNSFTEALHLELENVGSRVTVQALCPGFTYTEFHDTMGVGRSSVPRSLWMKAEFVVEESLKGLDSRKLYVIPGWRYRWFVTLGSRIPTSWRVLMERKSPHSRGRVAPVR